MKVLSRAIVAVLFALSFAYASASPLDGWYGGLAIGQSTVDMNNSDWDDGTLAYMTLDNQDIAYKVIAGYRFTPRISVEGGYVYLGKVNFTGIEPGLTPSLWQAGPVTGEATSQGINLEGVYRVSFWKRWAVFAKGGIFMFDTTTLKRPTISGGTLALGDEIKVNDDGIRWIVGAGADLRVYRNWHMRLEWEHATVRFNGTLDRGVDLPTLGVTLDL